MKSRKFLQIGTLLGVLALTAACSDDDNNTPLSPTSTPESNVMVIHASPNAPGVDIILNDAATPAVEDLVFPTNTGYVPLSSGTINVKVNAANSTTTVINENLTLAPNTVYSVFAVDSLSKITVLVTQDDLTPPAAGKAHVRFIHLSPDAPAVDVALAGGAAVFPNVAFTQYTAFTPLDAGTYNLEVRLAGQSAVVLPLPGITLENGKIYTVFAKGFAFGNNPQPLGAEIIVNK